MTDPTRAELLVAYLLKIASGIVDLDCENAIKGGFAARCDVDRARALLGDGWKPIETAPKDGTTILLWSEYMSEPCTGAWGTQSHGRLGWNAKHDGMWVVESEHDLSGTTYKEIAVATHWCPLPAPPSVNADKEPTQ